MRAEYGGPAARSLRFAAVKKNATKIYSAARFRGLFRYFIAIGVWGTVPHLAVAALTALGLLVAAANAALGAALESIARDNMLISRLRHSSPTRWRGA